MEILDETPPHCPEDDTVMRGVVGGWRCPTCGHLQQAQDVGEPRALDIRGRRDG